MRVFGIVMEIAVATWYFVLALTFVMIATNIRRVLRLRSFARSTVALCWMFVVGTIAFAVGVGGHYFGLALQAWTTPTPTMSTETSGLMLIVNGMQIVGVPMAIIGGWLASRYVTLRLQP